MCTVGLNVVNARKNLSNERLHLRDFGVISAPAKTAQVWKMQPNGMVATFTSVGADASTVKSIRRHMRFHRLEYLRANYSDLKFGNQQIRGRADLEFGTGHNELNCRYRDVPGGGELRWITKDSVMLDSLKEWATAVGTSPVS